MNTTHTVHTPRIVPAAVKIVKAINLAPIFSVLFGEISTREQQILEMRFGLDTHSKHTLEAIGQQFGITRERVRQIENAAIKKLSAHVAGTDLETIINYTVSLLQANGDILEKYRLLRELLGAIQSDVESDMNYLELTLMLSEDITTVHNTIKFHPHYHLNTVTRGTVGEVTSAVMGQLKKKKDVMTLETLEDWLATHAGISLSVPTISNICKIAKELKVVDEEAVGLFKWAHINPRNIHDKIVFVLKESEKPMHFNEITEAIRNHKFDEKRVNVQAVHNELIRDEKFVLIGRGIYALTDWGYTPGTVSDVIVGILEKEGPLDRDTIVDKVLEVRQVKKITIQLNLKNKALFTRVGRNTYGLKK